MQLAAAADTPSAEHAARRPAGTAGAAAADAGVGQRNCLSGGQRTAKGVVPLNINYNTVSSWAAVVAAMTAVVALWLEGRRSRFSHGLDILLKLDEAFLSSEEFRKKRRTAANLILENDLNLERVERFVEIDDILDHFQMTGLLLRRGVLDKELVWAHFFYWLNHYYSCLKPRIASLRRLDPTVWEDAEWLYKQMVVIDSRHRPEGTHVGPSEEALREFLVSESTL